MMRLVRLLIFLLAVFIIIFLISLLLPSKVTVTKSVEINASPEKVSRQIVVFEEWKNWYPAFKDEDISVIHHPPAPGTLPSVTLKDKQGKVVTLRLVDSAHHTIDIGLESSSPTKVNYQFILIPKMHGQTQLTWNVNTRLGWLPWRRFEGILLDKFSGAQYEAALDDLRKAAEH